MRERWQQLPMKTEHKEILELIRSYLEKNPDLRFTQALFNLDINQKPIGKIFDNILRDNHGDKDPEVLKRINDRLNNLKNK